MAIDVPIVAARPQAALSTAEPEAATFDKRWAAWQAKGAANDRAVARTMALAVPIVIVVAAVVIYVLLGS
jgi:small-conductance mechanosensitive channel